MQPEQPTYQDLEQRIQELTAQLNAAQEQCQAMQATVTARTRQAQEAIATRLLYEQTLSACSQVLLANIEEREEALTETLYEFLVATDVSRIYICKNFTDNVAGKTYFQQTHEMCALAVPPKIDDPALQYVSYDNGLARWKEQLSHGKSAWGTLKTLSPPEQKYLKLRQAQSVLLLPVWVEGRWYGFIGLDDLITGREWRAEDIQLLQTAVDLIGGYIGRKRAERALRESEEKYRTLIEQSSDAIFLIYGGRFELVNSRFTELFGITQADVNSPNFTFSSIITPRQDQFDELTGEQRQAQKHRPPYEFTAIDKLGNRIYVELSMSYPLYKQGLATQGIIRDITSRKRHEEEKRHAYEKIQQYANDLAEKIKEEQRQREIAAILAEVVASISLTLTPNEILNQILHKLQQLVPYDSAAVYLVNNDQLLLQAAHGYKTDFIDRAIALEQSLLFQEIKATRSYILIIDSSLEVRPQFWMTTEAAGAWIGAPLLVAQDVIGFLAVHRHMPGAYAFSDAELVQAFAHQVAQTIYNTRLFGQLKETQAQLVQRERLAALGQMAATVAHELRNPLMSLRMGVDYFTFEAPPGSPDHRAAELMKSNMERISSIVENILFVARSPRLSPVQGSLRALIEREISQWETKFNQKQILCRLDLAEQLPESFLDFDQLGRILSNLIGNSIDATETGGELRVELFGDDNGWQIITVADTGFGIAAENQTKIFEPFFTTKPRGTGLGLAIVKQIVDGHGGKISVWSEPGKGTRFTVALPPALGR